MVTSLWSSHPEAQARQRLGLASFLADVLRLFRGPGSAEPGLDRSLAANRPLMDVAGRWTWKYKAAGRRVMSAA